MNFKSLVSMNAASTNQFFSKTKSLSLQSNAEFFSDFEQYCFQGNLENIEEFLENHAPKHEYKLLNGLLICIHKNHLNIFNVLLQHHRFIEILNRHELCLRQYILQHGNIHFLTALERHGHLQHHHQQKLGHPSLEYALEYLKTFYHSQLTSRHHSTHQQQMLAYLAKLYQQHKCELRLAKDLQISLPLDFESYQMLSHQLEPSDQIKIQQIYQSNLFHTAWRLLHPNELWFNDHKEFEISQHLKKYSWLVTLMWISASDSCIPPTKDYPIHSVEERCLHFFQRLTLVCQEFEDVPKHLFQSVLGHPLTRLLTEDIVIIEQEHFIYEYFQLHLKTLTSDELQILYALIKDKTIFQFPDDLNKLSIAEDDIKTFERHMYEQWGNQWQSNHQLISLSHEILSTTALLIDSYQRVLLQSIKQILQQTFTNPGFFHNKRMISTSPKTTDDRVPLSYGVPESPKS